MKITRHATSLLPLERKLLAHLKRTGLIRPGERGLVCLSGGGDSTALLLLLHRLRERFNLTLEVLHFDHGLRPDSAADAGWCEALAGRLNLPFHLRRSTDLADLSSGWQAAARKWRRAESELLCGTLGADWAATAHQRDDHHESLLMGILRGRHIANLRGIAGRASPFVRPLLPFRRADLRAYLHTRGQDWLEDPSNDSSRYLRNRVRHEAVPLLDDLAGGALAERLDALERQSADIADLIRGFPQPQQNPIGEPPHWIDAAGLAGLPRAAATTHLQAFIQVRIPGAVRYDQMESAVLLARTGAETGTVHLPGGRQLVRAGARIFLKSSNAEMPAPVTLSVGGITLLHPAGAVVSLSSDRGEDGPGMVLHNVPPRSVLEMRGRKNGDRFHPPGRSRPMNLSRYLQQAAVPHHTRALLPLIVHQQRVIGIYPHTPAEGFAEPGRNGSSLRFAVDLWPAE